MLTIVIPGEESFDNLTQRFVTIGDVTLELEHSLATLAAWESKWEKSFLSTDNKTTEEILDYVRIMLLTPNVSEETLKSLTDEDYNQISEYINSAQTATTISERPGEGKSQKAIITAELIYYWMFSLSIPIECETWHLNRLITLIKVSNEKNSPQKKMSRREVMNRNRALNEARRKQFNTSG